MSWYWAVGLVLGNLAGLPLAVVAGFTGFYWLSGVTYASMIISMPYHLCQQGGTCFFLTLADWKALDHTTATWQLNYFALFLFTMRSAEQIERARRKRTLPVTTKKRQPGAKEAPSYYQVRRTYEENMIYDSFTAYATLIVALWTVIQVRANPDGSLAYINTLALTLLLGLFKLAVLDEGRWINLRNRFSWPELVLGLVLSLGGIVCFAIDPYVGYEWPHFFWHILIYLGMFLIFLGLILNTPHLWSRLQRSYARTRYYFTCGGQCCFPPAMRELLHDMVLCIT
jgi:hypothetical protein